MNSPSATSPSFDAKLAEVLATETLTDDERVVRMCCLHPEFSKELLRRATRSETRVPDSPGHDLAVHCRYACSMEDTDHCTFPVCKCPPLEATPSATPISVKSENPVAQPGSAHQQGSRTGSLPVNSPQVDEVAGSNPAGAAMLSHDKSRIPTPRTDAHLRHLNLPDGRKVGIPNETVEMMRQLEIELDGLRAMYRAACALAEEVSAFDIGGKA